MKFARSKKLVFCNNKGGVGKTTTAFHVGVELSRKGYRVALIDLDPQSNLTLQTLGLYFYEDTLFAEGQKTIYNVLQPKLSGGGDIDTSIKLLHVRDNLYILPGDIRLSMYEDLLLSSYNTAAAGNLRGYSDTSAINRYLQAVGMEQDIDIFIIDTSPSLGVLNRVIFLGADYFIVPVTPDSYSVQGVKNIGGVFESWKLQWKNTAKAVAGDTPSNQVLGGEGLFVGYILNSFNVYAKRVLRRQEDWLERIPQEVKESLSEKHCRNGLVEASWREPLGRIQDMGQLAAISMENNKAVQEFLPGEITELNLKGTKELQEKTAISIGELTDNLIKVLEKY